MTDYMQREDEVKKQPEFLQTLQEASCGDPVVFNALWSIMNFAHVFDDLIDETLWSNERKEQAAKALHDVTQDLLVNPFVRENAAAFRVLLAQMIGRWLDGDAMEKRGDPLAPAVRCGDTDFVIGVAHLAGGWSALRKLGSTRTYDTKG